MMFNTGQFVMEVKKRPCLWNAKDSANSDRQQKLKAYQDIAELLNASNRSYSLSNRNVTVADLQRKWKHLRDYYTRERKRGLNFKDHDTESDSIDSKSSSSARRKRNSPLLEMLQFLDANRGFEFVELTVEQLSAQENLFQEIKGQDENDLSEQEPPPPPKKQRINEETQLNKLNEDTEDCSEKQLLNSLMLIINNMSAHEKDDFRSQIMNSVAKSIGKLNTKAMSDVQSHTILQRERPSSSIDEEGNKTTTEICKHNRLHKSQETEEVNTPSKITEVTSKRDEFTIYGEYVANKLRNIPNTQARHTAEYHINSILYKAEMGEYDKVSKGTAKNSSKELESISDITNASSNASSKNPLDEEKEEVGDIVNVSIVKSEVIQLE